MFYSLNAAGLGDLIFSVVSAALFGTGCMLIACAVTGKVLSNIATGLLIMFLPRMILFLQKYLIIEDTIVDSAGEMGYSYPGDITNYPQATPVGALCHAQACIGVNHAGNMRITVSHYDGNSNRQSQTFVLDIE